MWLPWRSKKATSHASGLPSVNCALFCAIAAVLEDIPQLTIQLVFTRRTSGFSDLGSLPWELQLSMVASAVSLLFRVAFRCFIAISERCSVRQHEDTNVSASFVDIRLVNVSDGSDISTDPVDPTAKNVGWLRQIAATEFETDIAKIVLKWTDNNGNEKSLPPGSNHDYIQLSDLGLDCNAKS